MAKRIQTARDQASTANFPSRENAVAAKPDNPNYELKEIVVKEDIIIPAGSYWTWAPSAFSPKWFVAQVLMNVVGDQAEVAKETKAITKEQALAALGSLSAEQKAELIKQLSA